MPEPMLPPLPQGAVLEPNGLPPLPQGAVLESAPALPPGAQLISPTTEPRELNYTPHSDDWRDEVMDVKVPGTETMTKLRGDGYIWLDETKVPGKKPGWYTPDLWGGWKKGPDAPKVYKGGARPPHMMGDAEIAVTLLGMTPEQFMRMSTSPQYTPGMLSKGFDDPESTWSKNTFKWQKSAAGGLRKGFNSIAQLIHTPEKWLGNEQTKDLYTALGKINQMNQNLNQGRAMTEGGMDPVYMAAQFVPGQVLTGGASKLIKVALAERAASAEGMLATQVLPKATKLPGWAGTAARATAQIPEAAGAAFLTTPGDISDRTQAAAITAATVPVAHVALEKIVSPALQKLVNLASGKKPLPPEAQTLQNLADEYGVQVGASDLVKDPASMVKSQTELSTAAPAFGMSTFNTEQQAQAQRAASKLLTQLKQRMARLNFQNMTQLEAAAAKGDPKAVALLKLAEEAGDEPAKVVQADGNINLFLAQKRVDHAAERAIALETGAKSPMRATIDAVDAEIARIKAGGKANENAKLLAYLKKVKADAAAAAQADSPQALGINASGDSAASQEAINRVAQENDLGRTRYMINLRTGQATPMPASVDAVDQLALPNTAIVQKGVGKDPKAWVILDHNSKMPSAEVDAAMPRITAQLDALEAAKPAAVAEAPSTFQPTYTGLANYRKGVQQVRRDAFTPGSELTGAEATRALRSVQTGVERDMEELAALNPAQAKADRYMRDLHKETVVPFKSRPIIRLLQSETPDVIADKFRTMTPDQVKQISGVLGEKGKAAMTLNMVEDAFEKSLDRGRPGEYQFRPVEFAKEMQRQSESLGLVLKGEDKWKLDGFTKLMHQLHFAGTTGSAKGAFTLSQRMLGEPSVAFKWMLTTPAGKRLLLAASDLKTGSPKLAGLLEKLEEALPAAAGTKLSTPNSTEVPQ